FRVILHHGCALVVATTEFHLGLCVACFCLGLHFLNRFLIDLGLLRGQLNDSHTRRQQKREYQPTRFHILTISFPLFMANLCKVCFVFSERTTIMRHFDRAKLPITDPREASTTY